MKIQNGRMTAESLDVGELPNESDVMDMRQAHEALQSVFDQAMSTGSLQRLGNVSVRRDRKNGGFYAIAPVQTFIVGKSKSDR